MKLNWNALTMVTLVACSVATTALVAHREFAVRDVQGPQKPVFVADWKSALKKGITLGSADAPVQLIEFGDFECPACGAFHKTLKAVQKDRPGKVTLTYIEFPIPMHRFAIPAARAAECAAGQGQFEAMYDQLFDNQDSFGLRTWSEYATAAGLLDLSKFNICVEKTEPVPRVEQGKRLGTELDVWGTPTVIVNGWKLGQPPNEQELDQMVQRVLAGKQPIDGKS